jgi:hypothetical protein
LLPAARAFSFLHLEKDKGEPVVNLSKILKEFRLMGEKLSNWKFLLIWLLALVASSAPFLYGVARLIEAIKQ